MAYAPVREDEVSLGFIINMPLAALIKQRALEIGFDLAGIAPLAIWEDLAFSRHWVERGFGGEMRYLANPKRDDPRQILPSAKSVVCVGIVYNAPLPYSTQVGQKEAPGVRSRKSGEGRVSNFEVRISEQEGNGAPTNDEGPRAWISRYAWGKDYHTIMREKLERLRAAIGALAPGVETRVYVDTGPIVERAFARYSGIGWVGKNTCLINEHKGSYFFLGVILTSLEIEPDMPASDRCGSCTRCIEACPTAALVQPYVMDASRCIAYFTIELKGSIPEEFRPAIGANVFGCDICQDVCPWNNPPWSVARDQPSAVSDRSSGTGFEARGAATTNAPEFQPLQINKRNSAEATQQRATDNELRMLDSVSNFEFRVSLFNPPLEALASLSEADFRRIFAHSPIKRAKYRGWLRNLCVAMGNSGDSRFVPRLEHAREHPDPIVREHAEWALGRLAKKAPDGHPTLTAHHKS